MGNCYNRRSTPVLTIQDGNDEDAPYMLVANNSEANTSHSTGTHRLWRRTFANRSTQAHENNRPPAWPSYQKKMLTEDDIDEHVIKTLSILRSSAENDTGLILRMRWLRLWANGETGWNMVLSSLIRAVPMDDVLGPSAITLFIDHCPLPTKQAVMKLVSELDLSMIKALDEFSVHRHPMKNVRHRNVCAVLGHLAGLLASPLSSLMLTHGALEYFMVGLAHEPTTIPPINILYSLIALEKFAQTGENKQRILATDIREKLSIMEHWVYSTDYKKRQVGFSSQWLLDNTFVIEDRPFTYEHVDLSNINAMLNCNDVSEYLKISADGLEARSDASSFESVRCTFSVDAGVWYYEVTIITPGVMQIGWATKRSKFFNYDGYGIGDDEFSIAYDGCRQLCWHMALSKRHAHPPWKEGDVLGSLLDLGSCEAIFYLNGDPLPAEKEVFNNARNGFFAAASFMSHQQCIFNFGAKPFQFPPKDRNFSCFNDHAQLSEEEKLIIPKHKKAELFPLVIREDTCDLCCDLPADTTLLPCWHSGMCNRCALNVEICPLCREDIVDRIQDKSDHTETSDAIVT